MKKGLRQSIQKTVSAIEKAERILVASHVNPDGDTLGCLLALGLALLRMEKKVTLVCQDGIPSRFQFLPGSELIVSGTSERADVAIAVDCGSVRQLGKKVAPIFFKAKTTVQVDHHDFGQAFGKIQVLEDEASAVGEIVYELIQAIGVEVTPAIAVCLLTSIVIDTGSFRFSNIRAKTFDICSRLVKTGVDLRHLIEESYWIKSRSAVKLSSYGLLNADYSRSGEIAWTVLRKKDFVRYLAKTSDADSVADDLRLVEGVKIAAVFREMENGKWRVSLRSRHGINTGNVARLFGGGGHHNSAGCIIGKSEREKRKLLDELEKLVNV
ncbi:MAG: bifunctional oligoribonuclease/PAP phosphatase NrnA [Candidatus Omnitrophica bacterium]|nr:bifunctional oligoribonuclease/PAP phosphatase NrnA [Candidatus Omnitrophota bacterium]